MGMTEEMTSRPGGGRMNRTVLVVGGGVAGIHAALEAAALGHPVVLVEENHAIGGHMAQLDKTFPTQDCSLCTLSPRLFDLARNPAIRLLIRTRIEALGGCAGHFRVSVTQAPGYVDPDRCIGCGKCHEACPQRVPDPFNLGLNETRAIRALYPQAVPTTHAIDPRYCLYFRTLAKSKSGHGACRRCEKICPTGAIRFDDAPRSWQMEVGAVILAGGFELLGPETLVQPGWLTLPNVVTNLELERLLSSTGPNQGHIKVPGTDAAPRRVAFLQCMGSRDPSHGVAYCSSVCCSASLKQATLLAANPAVQAITICAIDLRTHGRECEQFLRRVRRNEKIRFVTGKVGAIRALTPGGPLLLTGAGDGRAFQLETDLAVLAMGIRPQPTATRAATAMGVELDRHGFVNTRLHHPVSTRIDGIYACGTLIGPKSIPTSVQEAGAAAFQAALRLTEGFRPGAEAAAEPAPELPTRPPEIRQAGPRAPAFAGAGPQAPPRIGVFVCRCGTNIAGVLDTWSLAEQAAAAPGVVWAQEELFTCSQDATGRMAEIIRSHRLDRLVVASCSPRAHLPIFQEVATRQGLAMGLVEMANIREQCAWVHADTPAAAQSKAASLIRLALERVRQAQPVPMLELAVRQRALIFGAGIAALTAAVHLADAGIPCVLVNHEAELGGRMRHAFFDPKRLDCRKLQRLTLDRVARHPRIEILHQADLVDLSGSVGRFTALIRQHGGGIGDGSGSGSEAEIGAGADTRAGEERTRTVVVEAGAILAAIGADLLRPEGLHQYGRSPQVLTQAELAAGLAAATLDLEPIRQVAMIQCVGSRNDQRPYCSRSCCQQAVAHALELKKRYPHLVITILYRDLRTYGTAEQLYQEAREAGVRFMRYAEQTPPQVTSRRFGRRSTLDLDWTVPGDGLQARLRVGLLVLSTATVPSPWAESLALKLKVPLSDQGFFLEKHIKLAPVETAVEGIFIAGQCHCPETLTESLVQGQAAAAKMLGLLRRKRLRKPAFTAAIDPARCSRCLSCHAVCPARAVIVPTQGGPLTIDPMTCLGCGLCAAECPAGAIEVAGARDKPLASSAATILG